MLRLRTFWIELRSSLWFLPSLIVFGCAVAAMGFIEIDYYLSQELLNKFPRLFGAGAEGSRGMLTAIAGSMITVAGVTFSITIVALAQAASQYSSRILRNFMRDRANQSVLGIFLGIFVYCLLVLRSIRGGDEGEFVPSLSVLGGVVLALLGIGVLIYFIHHAAASLQASNVIAAAAHETFNTIDHLFPALNPEPETELTADTARWLERQRQIVIPAPKSGYLQSYDEDALVDLACEREVVLRLHQSVGEFVVFDTPFVTVYTNAPLDEDMVAEVYDAFGINALRTIEQDAGFGIRQIVDIALKALSPGVNDTTTALTSIDYLAAVNAQLASRRIARSLILKDGKLRLIVKSPSFEMFLAESFDEIRASARDKAAVIVRLLQALKVIAVATDARERKCLVAKQVCLLEELAHKSSFADYEMAIIQDQLQSPPTLSSHTEDQ